MAIIQISLFKALPVGLRKWLAYFPVLAILVNFLGSFTILFFTGVASFVGISNLMASVIFGGYIVAYKRARGIRKQRGVLFPKVIEENPNPGGLF